ncbi:MAG: hypothetical protein ACK58T_32835, partial [Phycisphaerae bacterium]
VLRETDSILGIKLANDPMSIAELATLYALLAGTLDPVRKLSGIFEQIKRGMAGSERVFELIDEKSIVPEPRSPKMMVRHSTMISLQDVSFRYEPVPGDEQQRP